ncbi:hypothetical protein [Micromonospora sp. CB01531]|nr:hypothetical protein [Micromonospora sp. CB01531]
MTTKHFRTITADGQGLWSVGDTTAGFWLEADTGTEPLVPWWPNSTGTRS